MNSKFIKIFNIVALCLMGATLIFAFALLGLGTFSEGIKQGEGTEGIGVACAVAVAAVGLIFGLLVQLLGGLVGLSAAFPRKNRALIVITGVIAAVISVLAAFIIFYCLIIYLDVTLNNIHSHLTCTAMILCIVADLIGAVSFILRFIWASKNAKLLKQAEEIAANQELSQFTVGGEAAEGAADSEQEKGE